MDSSGTDAESSRRRRARSRRPSQRRQETGNERAVRSAAHCAPTTRVMSRTGGGRKKASTRTSTSQSRSLGLVQAAATLHDRLRRAALVIVVGGVRTRPSSTMTQANNQSQMKRILNRRDPQGRSGGLRAARQRPGETRLKRLTKDSTRRRQIRERGAPHIDKLASRRTQTWSTSWIRGEVARIGESGRRDTTANVHGADGPFHRGTYCSGGRRRATRKTPTLKGPRSPRAIARCRSGAQRGTHAPRRRALSHRSAHAISSRRVRTPAPTTPSAGSAALRARGQ